MSTRRDGQGRRRVGRRRGFSIESLERRELLTAAETFAGPSLSGLIKQAEQGKDTEPAIVERMASALQSQLETGPLADLADGAVDGNGFLAETQSLEISYEQYADQELSPKFPNLDQFLKFQGQDLVDGLQAQGQQNAAGLISLSDLYSSYQSTVLHFTPTSIQAINPSTTVMAGETKAFRTELNTLSNHLGNGNLSINQLNTTLDAEAEAYRAEVHAETQIADPAVSGHADTDINTLESTAISNPALAIKDFVNSVLDTTGLFGPDGGFSKGNKTVDLKPGATNHQVSSIVSSVSGSTATDGTASLTATLASFDGSPVMGQTVDFSLDGAFAGIAVTNFVGVAILNEVPTSDAVGTDTDGVVATFASDTNFVSSNGSGNLTVNQTGTTVSAVSGTAVYGGPDTLQAVLTYTTTGQALAGQTVTFSVDGNTLGTAVTDSTGLATLSGVLSSDAAGTDSGGIVASFAGTSTLASSAAEGDLVVSQSGTTLSAVSGTDDVGGTATLNATLTSNETGQGVSGETINFILDGASVGTATTGSNGVATLTGVTTTDAIGTDTGGIVASFAGDTNYTSSSDTGNLVVTQTPTTLGDVSGTASYGGTATLDATLTNASTGSEITGETVKFTLDGVSVGSAVTNSSGLASLAGVATTDAVGTDTNGIIASFAGDTDNAPAANVTGNLVVSQAGTTLTDISGTAALNGSATLTATLSSSVTSQPLSGQTVSFALDGKTVGTAVTNSNGVATLSGVSSSDGAGTDNSGVVATFEGDTDYATSSATGNLTVADSPTSIGSVSGTDTYGGTATLVATFTSTATGDGVGDQTISFTLDGKSVGTATTNSSGVATLSGVATTDAVGTDSNGVVASFAGSDAYAAATGTGNLVVSQSATSFADVAGSVTSGSTATLTATLDSTATGFGVSGQTVSFMLDGVSAGTATTNDEGVATVMGVATTDTSTDTGGVVVNYAGNTDYLASQGTGNLVVVEDN